MPETDHVGEPRSITSLPDLRKPGVRFFVQLETVGTAQQRQWKYHQASNAIGAPGVMPPDWGCRLQSDCFNFKGNSVFLRERVVMS